MKTRLRKPARGRARYSEEYKKEALQLWRASGRSASFSSDAAIMLEEFAEVDLGNALQRRAERLPNLLAAYESSGIVTPRFMAVEILQSSRFPRGLLGLHGHDREIDREKRQAKP
jgi:hypothetical protein